MKFETPLTESYQVERARLLALAESESGLWLKAIQVPSLGTQLKPDTFTVSVVLWIGAPVCEPHVCRSRANVSTLGLHNLACRLSPCRLVRHVELNDVVKRAHQTSEVPCLLEKYLAFQEMMAEDQMASQSLRINMVRPCAGIALVDIFVDIFASTRVNKSAVRTGSAANAAETVK